MTDTPEKPFETEMEGPGAQLRRARERRGLLLHDVAQELHLDEWMLKALEEDDFAALGAPVFTKGHMRKYGDMLGLNSDDLMIAYYRKRGRDDSPPPITQMMAPESQPVTLPSGAIGRLLLAALVIGVAAFLIWFFLRPASGPADPDPAEVSPSQPDVEISMPGPREIREQVPLEMTAELPGMTADSPAPETVVTDDTPDSSADEDAARAAALQVEPAAAVTGSGSAVPTEVLAPADSETEVATPESIELRLVLSGESWVEVTDSDGNRLVYAMMTAGRVRTVSGRPPIEVFLGLSRAVQVEVNGRAYPVPRTAVRGNTARFVIDADSLR